MRRGWRLGLGIWFGLSLGASAAETRPLPRFERIVIDDDFPSGYQIEVADVNGDGKADLIGVGGSTCAWYENPSWKKRIITDASRTPGIISSATVDLDGDGKAEVAIAYEFEMNGPKRGKLGLAKQGPGPDAPWEFTPLADVPSIHRLRWGNIDGDGRPALVVASLFGPKSRPPDYTQDRAGLLVARRVGADRWQPTLLGKMPILHAIDVIDLDGDGRAEILTASKNGVGRFARVPPIQGLLPTILAPAEDGQGASEVHAGRLADGRRLLATIEPWHGSHAVVRLSDGPGSLRFTPPTLLDRTLDDGHALWVADVDGDGDDEVFAGHRGKDARVSAYDFDGQAWTRTVLDAAIAAQDLRGGDLDGDGTPDVVAIGGKTHNVVWYRPIRADK